MKRKWGILILIIIIGGAFFINWKEQSKLKVMGNIINSIPLIDSIKVIDGKIKGGILTITHSEPLFSDMKDVYKLPYKDLKRSERNLLLKGKPFIEIEFLQNNKVEYTINIYKVEDNSIPLLTDEYSTETFTYNYSYSPQGSNVAYIFAIEEINQLLAVNEGLKELLNMILTNNVK